MPQKVKMTQKEFDEVYEITGDTEVNSLPIEKEPIPKKQDTTQEISFEDFEIEADDKLKEELNWNEEDKS